MQRFMFVKPVSLMWLEMDLETRGQEIRIGGRGSRGERALARTLSPECSVDAMQSFATKVGRAARAGRPLDPALVATAQYFYNEFFQGDLRDVITRMRESNEDGRLVMRLFAQDRALSVIPFEALCKPGTTEGFLGTSPRIVLARGMSSPEPWAPREVRGAVRVLSIAPGSDERALTALREALSSSMAAGEIEWLDPICGPEISPQVLYGKLRRGKPPHIVHFLGHGGVDAVGRPVLRMADSDDGDEVWISAEAFARELSASFCEELRLVILEACEGARAGELGSAAELLAMAGADAVVAYLWPVKADVARTCSTELYRALTGADHSKGDVGTSVAAARRTLLAQGAEAFSPILYLRGSDSVIFDFEGRRISRSSNTREGRGLAPALQSLLEKPFTVILGDLDEERDALKQELAQFMAEQGAEIDPNGSLFTLTQRCLMMFGQEILQSLFQQSLAAFSSAPTPTLIHALGRLIPPGVHVTLLWRPYLERAIAEKQPDRNVYAVQPSLAACGAKPRIVKRAAGSQRWKTEPIMPRRFDTENDIVVLRLYGGYSAEAHPILSQPVLTEDDHFHGLLGTEEHPAWLEELLARPRIQPGLLVGLSIFDWRHRMILRWLYDHSHAPPGSLALLTPKTSTSEHEVLDSGGGLAGAGRIAAIIEDPRRLASLLDAFDPGAQG
jgi:CHAT domain